MIRHSGDMGARLSGAVLLDLRDLDAQAARRRCAALSTVPAGCRLVLLVGALAPPYEVTSLLMEHVPRLSIDVWGEPYAVPRWLAVLAGEDASGVMS